MHGFDSPTTYSPCNLHRGVLHASKLTQQQPLPSITSWILVPLFSHCTTPTPACTSRPLSLQARSSKTPCSHHHGVPALLSALHASSKPCSCLFSLCSFYMPAAHISHTHTCTRFFFLSSRCFCVQHLMHVCFLKKKHKAYSTKRFTR